jgi:two-component system, OmpR family, response regulator CpxR
MSKTIFIVDDDVELCSLMKDFFAQQGFRTECAHDGQAGLVRALEGGFDLLILDAMLPVLDGFELLRLLRKQSAIPVIMLTARTAQHDRIKGLDAGADDYLPKPFGPEELAAHVRAVLCRMGKAETLVICFRRAKHEIHLRQNSVVVFRLARDLHCRIRICE